MTPFIYPIDQICIYFMSQNMYIDCNNEACQNVSKETLILVSKFCEKLINHIPIYSKSLKVMQQSNPLSCLFVDYMTQKCCWIKFNEHADNVLRKHRSVVYTNQI